MTFNDSSRTVSVETEPYCWFRRVGMAALAVAVFLACHLAAPGLVGETRWNLLWLLGTQGITGAILLLLAILQYRRQGGFKALLGHDPERALRLGAPLIIVAYLVVTFIEAALGHTQGTFRGPALSDFSAVQIMLFFAMLLVFPAITEELLYRHFLIRLFPLNGRTWQTLAVIVTTLLFMQAQGQYQQWPSYLLMGGLGVILGVARIVSGGLAAPILLHALADATGMTSDLFLTSLD